MLLLVLACLSCVLLAWLRCAFGAAFSSTAAYFAIKPMHAPHRPTILLNCHSDNYVRLASTALIATGAASGCGTAPALAKTASGCGTVPVLAKSGLGLRCKRWMTFQKFGKPQVKRVWPFVSHGIHRSPRRKNAAPKFLRWEPNHLFLPRRFSVACRRVFSAHAIDQVCSVR